MEAAVSGALDPRVIEEEIARIREKESNPYSSGTKTNIFTLLIFRAEGLRRAGRRRSRGRVLQFLLGKRPARIITIRARACAADRGVGQRPLLPRQAQPGRLLRGGPHRMPAMTGWARTPERGRRW